MSEDPGTKNDIITLLSWDDFGMIWDRVGRYKYFVSEVTEYKKILYFFRVAFRVALCILSRGEHRKIKR